mmetsp:Transcript_8575/g.28367  ORF Transcript_8575/g.28367 Transcript_8575/m.28367 type:complete len:280 (-) Transcript_8575:457-1296(-)
MLHACAVERLNSNPLLQSGCYCLRCGLFRASMSGSVAAACCSSGCHLARSASLSSLVGLTAPKICGNEIFSSRSASPNSAPDSCAALTPLRPERAPCCCVLPLVAASRPCTSREGASAPWWRRRNVSTICSRGGSPLAPFTSSSIFASISARALSAAIRASRQRWRRLCAPCESPRRSSGRDRSRDAALPLSDTEECDSARPGSADTSLRRSSSSRTRITVSDCFCSGVVSLLTHRSGSFDGIFRQSGQHQLLGSRCALPPASAKPMHEAWKKSWQSEQ